MILSWKSKPFKEDSDPYGERTGIPDLEFDPNRKRVGMSGFANLSV
jgi:hypothetical protein